MVVLDNGVRIILRDLVEHLFAQSGSWLVHKKVYLPDGQKPLYVVAYRTRGYNEPVILLTDMVAEAFDLALQIRKRFVRRWDCETSIEFLKSKIGLERFAVRRYKSMQRLIFLAGLAMAFLSYLQSRCKDIYQRVNDHLRYSRQPKSFWFYRLLIGLQDAFFCCAKMKLLLAWIMYADDNDGKIVSAHTGSGGWITWAPDTMDTPEEEQIEGIKFGLLFPYCKNVKLYRCPTGLVGEMRTYSIVIAMNGGEGMGPVIKN